MRVGLSGAGIDRFFLGAASRSRYSRRAAFFSATRRLRACSSSDMFALAARAFALRSLPAARLASAVALAAAASALTPVYGCGDGMRTTCCGLLAPPLPTLETLPPALTPRLRRPPPGPALATDGMDETVAAVPGRELSKGTVEPARTPRPAALESATPTTSPAARMGDNRDIAASLLCLSLRCPGFRCYLNGKWRWPRASPHATL